MASDLINGVSIDRYPSLAGNKRRREPTISTVLIWGHDSFAYKVDWSGKMHPTKPCIPSASRESTATTATTTAHNVPPGRLPGQPTHIIYVPPVPVYNYAGSPAMPTSSKDPPTPLRHTNANVMFQASPISTVARRSNSLTTRADSIGALMYPFAVTSSPSPRILTATPVLTGTPPMNPFAYQSARHSNPTYMQLDAFRSIVRTPAHVPIRVNIPPAISAPDEDMLNTETTESVPDGPFKFLAPFPRLSNMMKVMEPIIAHEREADLKWTMKAHWNTVNVHIFKINHPTAIGVLDDVVAKAHHRINIPFSLPSITKLLHAIIECTVLSLDTRTMVTADTALIVMYRSLMDAMHWLICTLRNNYFKEVSLTNIKWPISLERAYILHIPEILHRCVHVFCCCDIGQLEDGDAVHHNHRPDTTLKLSRLTMLLTRVLHTNLDPPEEVKQLINTRGGIMKNEDTLLKLADSIFKADPTHSNPSQ